MEDSATTNWTQSSNASASIHMQYGWTRVLEKVAAGFGRLDN